MAHRPTESLLAQLADDLADAVVRRYRLDRAETLAAIRAEFSRRPALLDAAEKAIGLDDIKRMRVYRDAAEAVKKNLYYGLRQYLRKPSVADQDSPELAQLTANSAPSERLGAIQRAAREHVSTSERLAHLPEFFEQLMSMIGVPETIVDVGCGVLPILAPLDGTVRAIREYWALDKDRAAMTAVREYARLRADDRVRPLEWSLSEGWARAHDAGLPRRCDVGLLLKVVPVVARRSSALLTVLAATPADRLVISGSRFAMAKHQDIERRETRLLRRFIATHGLRELDSFRTPDEIVFLVERATR
jgi:ribosomal RNA methyltransferase FmrO